MSERYDRIRRMRRERRRQRRQQRSFKKTVKSMFAWCIVVLTAAILGYGFVAFGFQKVYMVGPSMDPTLKDGHDYTANQVAYLAGSPDRYDVVAYRTVDNQTEYYSIKRVIGLPGETVEIKDGKVYIDGSETALDDSFIPEKMQGSFGPYTVPDNCYFMLGDNRNDSKDSRFWKNTFVRFDQIVGKAVVRYYPSIKLLGYEEP